MKKSWQTLISMYDKSLDDILNNIEQQRINLQDSTHIFPETKDIFKCFNYCEVEDIKVVIIGQDPYHGLNQATGLCFAVESHIKQPPSLKNIINELDNDLQIKLTDTTLQHWARQGVLLMNASFSVIQSTPGSHMSLWSDFTNYIIKELNKRSGIVFVAWGAFAHTKFKNIDINQNYLLVSSHPSPLSYTKMYKTYPCFKNSKPFSKINNILNQQGKNIINW